jgi:hypothetical protein
MDFFDINVLNLKRKEAPVVEKNPSILTNNVAYISNMSK